ncbi:MAG: hypothetical protein J0L81_09590 [Caulobacterales bacterium]|jgi:hypothetical protein|nr:hypothetical protein [Caulobacterales bacterium]
MQRSTAPREILEQCACGACAGLLFSLTLLVVDAGDLRSLLNASPQFSAVFLFGAFFSFLPLVLCVAIGLVRRGEQETAVRQSKDDHPL